MSRAWSGRTRTVTGALAWLAAVGAATLVGLTAVNAIGSGIVGPGEQPLAPAQVEALVAAIPSNPATGQGAPAGPGTPKPSTGAGVPSGAPPPATTSPNPPTPGEPRAFTTHGGTVIARCAGGRPEVLATTPAQGYQVVPDRDLDDGPAVKFVSGESEVEVELRCAGSTPQADIQPPE